MKLSNIFEGLKMVGAILLLILYGSATLGLMMLVGPTLFAALILGPKVLDTLAAIVSQQGFPDWFVILFVLIEATIFIAPVIYLVHVYGESLVEWWFGLYAKIGNLV